MPWLATSYDTHTDGMGVDVTLRKGIEWSDGEYERIKYTIEIFEILLSLVLLAK